MVLNQTYHVIQLHGFAAFKLRLLKLASLLVHHSPSPKHKQKPEHLFWDAILQVCTLIPLYLQTNKQTNKHMKPLVGLTQHQHPIAWTRVSHILLYLLPSYTSKCMTLTSITYAPPPHTLL
jgi:hypothetical protein